MWNKIKSLFCGHIYVINPIKGVCVEKGGYLISYITCEKCGKIVEAKYMA